MDIVKIITDELEIKKTQTEAVIKLIDEGNTIPFIARYRKEATGSLNDEVLRKFEERLLYLRNLDDRKNAIIASIEEQGKMTDGLKQNIDKAMTLVEVEDLYRPYKQKKKTRAIIAKEKGLEPLATLIYNQELKEPVENIAKDYINEEKEVLTVEDAIKGAMDIIAEMISDVPEYRKWIRNNFIKNGFIKTSGKLKDEEEKEKSTYAMYEDYRETIKTIPGHRTLAINRGESEKMLQVKVELDSEDDIFDMFYKAIMKKNMYTEEVMKEIIKDAYQRLIFPAIEREIRNELTKKAEDAAIVVFSKNLKQILMQPPIANQVVLGLDPAYRTGCKLAVVDSASRVLDTAIIYPTPPQNKIKEAGEKVLELIKKYKVTLISIGNGTASRESEKFIADLIRASKLEDVKYAIVNEAGASVYSASKLAQVEFPNFDVAQRSAVSIARRLQDPLAELVKIEPKAIGVGQYQHDMNQKNLKTNLDNVVEDVVNNVGVDLNTASASLLKYVAGINERLAKAIVEYRENESAFTSRREILKVKGLGAKAFEQCAGFLRIPNAKNVLDQTAVHPESYDAANKLAKELDIDLNNIKQNMEKIKVSDNELEEIAKKIEVGMPTLVDILEELKKPGRDPRSEMPKPIFKCDILDVKDLKEGMILDGVVRNLVDFGVFVDIGVHQDGMVHISEITDKYIKHPLEVLNIGDNVKVKVLSIDEKRNRIALTMKVDK